MTFYDVLCLVTLALQLSFQLQFKSGILNRTPYHALCLITTVLQLSFQLQFKSQCFLNRTAYNALYLVSFSVFL